MFDICTHLFLCAGGSSWRVRNPRWKLCFKVYKTLKKLESSQSLSVSVIEKTVPPLCSGTTKKNYNTNAMWVLCGTADQAVNCLASALYKFYNKVCHLQTSCHTLCFVDWRVLPCRNSFRNSFRWAVSWRVKMVLENNHSSAAKC